MMRAVVVALCVVELTFVVAVSLAYEERATTGPLPRWLRPIGRTWWWIHAGVRWLTGPLRRLFIDRTEDRRD